MKRTESVTDDMVIDGHSETSNPTIVSLSTVLTASNTGKHRKKDLKIHAGRVSVKVRLTNEDIEELIDLLEPA
jgi:hypothetical protein